MNTIPSTDADLVAATLRGNRTAFSTLVERHQQFVCALAYAKTGSVAASEDIAQETFVSAWKNLAGIRAPENFRGWLCGTVRHLSAKFRRRDNSSAPLTDDLVDSASSPNEAVMSREEEAMLWATLEQLPENHREPLILFYRGGQSVREIAEALDLNDDAVKQRLSRGRAMLQEAVRVKVETALTRSRPGAAFTIGVLAAIPALATTAQAAGTGLAVAKSAGAVTVAGLSGLLGGGIIGFAGAWFGMKCSLERAESARERRFIVRVAGWTVGTVFVFMGALAALIFWGNPLLAARPGVWIVLMAGVVLAFTGAMFLLAFLNGCVQLRIRAEERNKRGVNPQEVDPNFYEYRSRWEFLGLPLVHIRLGSSARHVARGWIAYGNIAIAPLLAFGGIAVGGIAMGGVAVGIFTTAGIGIGLFSFSGLAMGGVVMGGLAMGWIALGGGALGGLAAYGGAAWAGVYGLGRLVAAPHANDAAAKAFFHDHGLTQIFGWIADHGWLVQLGVFLPIGLVMCVVFRLRSRARTAAKLLGLLLVPIFLLSCAPKKGDSTPMEIGVKTMPETLLFCVAEEVTQPEIATFAERAVGPLFEALGRLGQHPMGDLQFICPEWKGPVAKSRVVFAIPAAKELPVEAPYFFWKAPASQCAWVEYVGPMSGIRDAWDLFAVAVQESDYRPVGGWREVYVHWVAPDSAEDRTELQMDIQ